MNPEFWHSRRVFLTGHTGFKGGWLSLWLQALGAELSGFALEPATTPSLYEVAQVGRGLHCVIADIRDPARLLQAMQAARPEVVIHMAAQPLVRASYDEPVATYATNLMGTVHLLEAVRATPGVAAVVNVTTDKCYENREAGANFGEQDPLGGYDPYSSSKACAEIASAAYRSSFFNPADYQRHKVAVATARAGNVIGGGDWAADRLVPDILTAFEQGRPARIRNPHAVRPWQHVLEPLRGYLALAERLCLQGPAFGEAWNFGPDEADAQPVSWIVENMARLWGHSAAWEYDGAEHPHEAGHLKLDISKARARLDWRPAISLETALEMTMAWSQARRGAANMREFTMAQIQTYQARTCG